MRGLLLQLSDLDPNTHAYLRVIQYFDRLVNNGINLEGLTRASAALGNCTVGLRDQDSGVVIRFDHQGQLSPQLVNPVVLELPIVINELVVGHVWLEREKKEQLDEILLERMSIAATVLWRSLRSIEGSDPALLELAISALAEDQDRIRALRLIGFNPLQNLRVMATSIPDKNESMTMQNLLATINLNEGLARSAMIGTVGVVLIQIHEDKFGSLLDALDLISKESIQIGIGQSVPAARAYDSWSNARLALRFAPALIKNKTIVNYEDLGSFAVLATIPSEFALMNPDVKALKKLSEIEQGDQDINILLSVTWSGSARQAATELFMHHSSITNRLKHIEGALNLSIQEPVGRLRAQMAAILFRLHQ
jgi:hypothetical protein